MITTPEIICDVFSLLNKDQIERIQIVSQFWNNVVICHKNILPLRLLEYLRYNSNRIHLYVTREDWCKGPVSYVISFDGTNLSKIEVSSRYSQLTVDEVLTNLNYIVFDYIRIHYCNSEDRLDNLLNLMKLVTTKIGGRFRGRFGRCDAERFGSKLDEIFDNYIILDELTLGRSFGLPNSYIREVCANPEIVQFPSTSKAIRLARLEFKENEEVLNFTCNGKLNRANRLTIVLETSNTNYGNFIRQWFELYRIHQNPISLIGKFEFSIYELRICLVVLDAVKTFLNNTQLRVKYSLETKEFHRSSIGFTNQYLKRCCVLHETDSYALVIEMEYGEITDMCSINASDLDQPPSKGFTTKTDDAKLKQENHDELTIKRLQVLYYKEKVQKQIDVLVDPTAIFLFDYF